MKIREPKLRIDCGGNGQDAKRADVHIAGRKGVWVRMFQVRPGEWSGCFVDPYADRQGWLFEARPWGWATRRLYELARDAEIAAEEAENSRERKRTISKHVKGLPGVEVLDRRGPFPIGSFGVEYHQMRDRNMPDDEPLWHWRLGPWGEAWREWAISGKGHTDIQEALDEVKEVAQGFRVYANGDAVPGSPDSMPMPHEPVECDLVDCHRYVLWPRSDSRMVEVGRWSAPFGAWMVWEPESMAKSGVRPETEWWTPSEVRWVADMDAGVDS